MSSYWSVVLRLHLALLGCWVKSTGLDMCYFKLSDFTRVVGLLFTSNFYLLIFFDERSIFSCRLLKPGGVYMLVTNPIIFVHASHLAFANRRLVSRLIILFCISLYRLPMVIQVRGCLIWIVQCTIGKLNCTLYVSLYCVLSFSFCVCVEARRRISVAYFLYVFVDYSDVFLEFSDILKWFLFLLLYFILAVLFFSSSCNHCELEIHCLQ